MDLFDMDCFDKERHHCNCKELELHRKEMGPTDWDMFRAIDSVQFEMSARCTAHRRSNTFLLLGECMLCTFDLINVDHFQQS